MRRRVIIGIIFVVAAILKLASMWNLIHMEWLWQHPWTDYLGPALLIYVGGTLIIHGFWHNHDQWLQRPVPLGETGKRIYCKVQYGTDEYVYHGEPFKGAHLEAICGGIRLDLRDAVITEDEEIDIHTCMGGVLLLVPDTVNVIVKSRSLIGGIGNETSRRITPGTPSLHIVASNYFGGVSINN